VLSYVHLANNSSFYLSATTGKKTGVWDGSGRAMADFSRPGGHFNYYSIIVKIYADRQPLTSADIIDISERINADI
jgi:hypothetical protein